ncbi:predicted protein [Nematostella vectensis]|uniref:Protein FAM189A1 n=1 Tax=Nematostella vectensis TaxID=45351 RepID=A7S4D6_NEMVE|nr:uncharacterized protein LOC5513279 [Nematostella vectensis]XP_048581129.1 uncharacterized protein LOC5513279 [Nematostella vectensis]EDO41456.1 predicted protein [Nematostella vectensis]|eukprot:XP_001633519.1 predicted protein [Nematostella vectensis]
MPTHDIAYQQRLKIRRTTLGFGVVQVILGLSLTGLSFAAFALSESDRIRNACPYWAGFTVFFSGGVGIVAWRHSTILSMGLFTFFSAVCVVLHMIGTILTGEVGGLLKSVLECQFSEVDQSCICCDSIMTCKQSVPSYKFEGVDDCDILTGLLKELMYGLCVLNIFGSLVCFIATILGCTSVARQAGRDQPLFRRRFSTRSSSHEQTQYSWLPYPTDLNMLPPYAPPVYRSVDNFQDFGATSYIVPPPVFDPTDLPPPYSSRDASMTGSRLSMTTSCEHNRNLGDDEERVRGESAYVTAPNQQDQTLEQHLLPTNNNNNTAQISAAVLTDGSMRENTSYESCHTISGQDAARSAPPNNNQDYSALMQLDTTSGSNDATPVTLASANMSTLTESSHSPQHSQRIERNSVIFSDEEKSTFFFNDNKRLQITNASENCQNTDARKHCEKDLDAKDIDSNTANSGNSIENIFVGNQLETSAMNGSVLRVLPGQFTDINQDNTEFTRCKNNLTQAATEGMSELLNKASSELKPNMQTDYSIDVVFAPPEQSTAISLDEVELATVHSNGDDNACESDTLVCVGPHFRDTTDVYEACNASGQSSDVMSDSMSHSGSDSESKVVITGDCTLARFDSSFLTMDSKMREFPTLFGKFNMEAKVRTSVENKNVRLQEKGETQCQDPVAFKKGIKFIEHGNESKVLARNRRFARTTGVFLENRTIPPPNIELPLEIREVGYGFLDKPGNKSNIEDRRKKRVSSGHTKDPKGKNIRPRSRPKDIEKYPSKLATNRNRRTKSRQSIGRTAINSNATVISTDLIQPMRRDVIGTIDRGEAYRAGLARAHMRSKPSPAHIDSRDIRSCVVNKEGVPSVTDNRRLVESNRLASNRGWETVV